MSLDKFVNYCRNNPERVVIFISSSFNGIKEQLNLYKLKNKVYEYDVLNKYIIKDFIKSNKNIQNLYKEKILAAHKLEFKNQLFNATIGKYISNSLYWVHSIPKTGNYSMIISLKNCGLNVYKNSLHSLDSHILKKFGFIDEDFKSIWNDLKKNIKIITMIRDPLAQNISHMFQYIDSLNYYPDTNNLQKMFDDIYIHNTYKDFNNEFLNLFFNDMRYKNFEVWFDKEIKTALDIDVFEYNFDKEKGYANIHKDNINLLLVKLENLENLEKVIGEFVNVPNFTLGFYNNSAQKEYNMEYIKFKENFRVPKIYINKLYDSKYMKHFYSEREINYFKKRWDKNIIK